MEYGAEYTLGQGGEPFKSRGKDLEYQGGPLKNHMMHTFSSLIGSAVGSLECRKWPMLCGHTMLPVQTEHAFS